MPRAYGHYRACNNPIFWLAVTAEVLATAVLTMSLAELAGSGFGNARTWTIVDIVVATYGLANLIAVNVISVWTPATIVVDDDGDSALAQLKGKYHGKPVYKQNHWFSYMLLSWMFSTTTAIQVIRVGVHWWKYGANVVSVSQNVVVGPSTVLNDFVAFTTFQNEMDLHIVGFIVTTFAFMFVIQQESSHGMTDEYKEFEQAAREALASRPRRAGGTAASSSSSSTAPAAAAAASTSTAGGPPPMVLTSLTTA